MLPLFAMSTDTSAVEISPPAGVCVAARLSIWRVPGDVDPGVYTKTAVQPVPIVRVVPGDSAFAGAGPDAGLAWAMCVSGAPAKVDNDIGPTLAPCGAWNRNT